MSRLSLRHILFGASLALLAMPLHMNAEESDNIPDSQWEKMLYGKENAKRLLEEAYKKQLKVYEQLQLQWQTKEDALKAEITSLRTQIDGVKANINELTAGVDDSPLARKRKKEERKAYEKGLKEEIFQTKEMLKLPWNEVSLDKLEALELKLQDKTLPNSLTSFNPILLQAIEDKRLTEEVVAMSNGPIKADKVTSVLTLLDKRKQNWNKAQSDYGHDIGYRLLAHKVCWEAICGLSDKTVALKQENFQNAGDKRLARSDEGYKVDEEKIKKLFADFRTSKEYGYIQKYQLEYLEKLLKEYEKAAIRNPYESKSLEEVEIYNVLHEYVK